MSLEELKVMREAAKRNLLYALEENGLAWDFYQNVEVSDGALWSDDDYYQEMVDNLDWYESDRIADCMTAYEQIKAEIALKKALAMGR